MVTERPAGLERLAEPFRSSVQTYAALVRELGGANAKALTLWGAVVTGKLESDRQVVRSVLVLERVDLGMLRRLSEHGAKLGKARMAAPLIMTAAYIRSSLDTFPLEFMEIIQQRLTLFGEDLFADLTLADADIRLQCERELKAALIGLRQGLLAAAGRERFIGELELGIAEGLLRTVRGMLWLKGIKDARPERAMLDELEKVMSLSLPGLRNALDPQAAHGWAQYEDFYRDVETLKELADAW